MLLQTKKNLNVYRICRMFWSKIRLGITPHGNNRNKDFCVSLSLIKRIRDQRREFNSTVVVTNKQVQILRTVLLHPRWHRFEGDVYFDLVFYFYFLILFYVSFFITFIFIPFKLLLYNIILKMECTKIDHYRRSTKYV